MPDKHSVNKTAWMRVVVFWVTALSLIWYSVYMSAVVWEKGRTWYEESLSAPVSGNVLELLVVPIVFNNGMPNQEPLMHLCNDDVHCS